MTLAMLLSEAQERSISEEEALFLFEHTGRIDNCLRLFETASWVRDNAAGKLIRLDAFLGGITPCEIEPPYGFCSRSSKVFKDKFKSDGLLTKEEIALGAKAIAKTGTTTVELGGGTSRKSAELIKQAIRIVQESTKLKIWINVGPSLNQKDVSEVKQMGVEGITSSFETMNKQIFQKVKSGDSLEKRIKLAEIID